MIEAHKKFHSQTSPRAKAYIYGTLSNIERRRSNELILKGTKKYLFYMSHHLPKEHPKTRGNIFIR